MRLNTITLKNVNYFISDQFILNICWRETLCKLQILQFVKCFLAKQDSTQMAKDEVIIRAIENFPLRISMVMVNLNCWHKGNECSSIISIPGADNAHGAKYI